MTETSFAFIGVFVLVFSSSLIILSMDSEKYYDTRETNERLSSLAVLQIAQPQGRWYWWRRTMKLCPSGPGPVVQAMDCAIHRINHYPADQYYRETNYPDYLIHWIETYQLGPEALWWQWQFDQFSINILLYRLHKRWVWTNCCIFLRIYSIKMLLLKRRKLNGISETLRVGYLNEV